MLRKTSKSASGWRFNTSLDDHGAWYAQSMMFSKLFDREWKKLVPFALIPVLTYLPTALRLTYYRDDWYYAYDARVAPAGVFRALFAIDRPARGPFFEIYYALFGMAPLPYHLSMFFWRLAGGLAVVWLCYLLWPRLRQLGLAAGLLFALYPGFTWWVSGIEYQPMVASAALMVVSLCFTLRALKLPRSFSKWVCVLAAIASGWVYLSLVEYAAGMEVFRLLLVYQATQPGKDSTFGNRALLAVRRWVVYLIIPASFFFWRFLLFTSQRKATDLGVQLNGFLATPVSTGLRWFVNFLLSLINVTLSAWVVPLMNNFFSNSTREVLLGLVLGLAAGALAWFMLHPSSANPDGSPQAAQPDWSTEAFWLGCSGLVLGILPVIVANRQISFPNFSHYALPASLGLVLVVIALASLISSPRAQTWALIVLVVLCVLTHQGLGASALHEEQVISNFWQQMAWRAPSIAPGTTLLAYYPGLEYADDTDIVWGPANYIYYPGRQQQLPVRAPISALPVDAVTFSNIRLAHDPQESSYRAHTMTFNYSQVLVISQTAADACVHVIDARWPLFSLSDDPALQLLAPFSDVENVVPAAAPAAPPAFLFGLEPKHGWCFYFERAALASQAGNWPAVADLESEVARLGLHPNDQIEWMPFLQADAYLGNVQKVKEIATRINTQKLYKQQACEILGGMAGYGFPLPADMLPYTNALFCSGKQ